MPIKVDPQNFLVRWVRYWLVTGISSETWNRGSGYLLLLRPREFLHLSPKVSKILTYPFSETLIVISLLLRKTNLIIFSPFSIIIQISLRPNLHPSPSRRIGYPAWENWKWGSIPYREQETNWRYSWPRANWKGNRAQ